MRLFHCSEAAEITSAAKIARSEAQTVHADHDRLQQQVGAAQGPGDLVRAQSELISYVEELEDKISKSGVLEAGELGLTDSAGASAIDPAPRFQ